MAGGTFTISNGGVFGSLFGTPIINPPQSAILGMHGVFDRPVVVNGKVFGAALEAKLRNLEHSLFCGIDSSGFDWGPHATF
jgi:2-oxoglutarate dehydrogenase E2 component (dihydrolipoamide succinyltransferase)